MKRLAFLIAILLIPDGAQIFAQAPLPDGTIAAVSKDIGNLVKLTWDEQRLVVDRDHWETAAGQRTEEDRQQGQIDAMIKRGVPAEIAKRMAARRRPRGANFLTSTPVGQLFEDLKLAAGATSGGGGGGDDDRHWRGHGGGILVGMQISGPKQDFRFMIKESNPPFQELVVADHHQLGLRIMYVSPKRQLVFSQRIDGSVDVAQTSDQNNLAVRAAGYEQLLQSQPGFAHEFKTLLNDLGIGAPFSLYDSRVVQTIAWLLHQPSAEDRVAAENLIHLLNSDSFQAREAAEKNLKENFAAFQTVIREKLAEENLDIETRLRLDAVVQSADVRSPEEEAFVEQRKLLDDAQYLQSILPEIPATIQPSVQRRIDQLNGENTRLDDDDGLN